MQSKVIDDSKITASSYYDSNHLPSYARLNLDSDGHGGWIPKLNTVGQWIQVALGKVTRITAIATQGEIHSNWVSTYSLQYSNDGTSFRDYDGGKSLDGNSDKTTVVKNALDPVITTKYIRLLPKKYQDYMGVRMELYGCHHI